MRFFAGAPVRLSAEHYEMRLFTAVAGRTEVIKPPDRSRRS
jgi:hypothetical protein